MKSLYPLALCAFALLSSCSEDADDPINPTAAPNQVSYNATKYSLQNGLLNNYGETDNHYNIDFSVSDGLFIPILNDLGNGFLTTIWLTSEATIEVAAELYAPGTDGFRTGTFEYTSLPESEVDDVRLVGQYFFNEAYVAIDTNGDVELDEDEEIRVIGGTIQVSGTYPRYTLVYDLALANGATLRGSYQDEFVVDE